MSDPRPIGFFDSGIGGLTVLRAVREKLRHENFIYLGDTARLPYGTKSPETIRKYTEQNIAALERLGVKAVVIACNSASTSILAGKENRTPVSSGVPLFNVIEPGAEAALAVSKSKRIGILGTRATVQSGAYVKAIHALAPKAEVFQQPAPLLVPLVEEGWENDPLTNLVIYRYLAPLQAQSIDTLVLGCTHYPALQDGIARVLGAGIVLVDSAHAIADRIAADLASGQIAPHRAGGTGSLELYATDAASSTIETARRLIGAGEIVFKPFDL